jgi:CheY-like chemotaxis protein
MHSVLVVEDHDDTRFVIAEYLTHAGFRVTRAATGIDALKAMAHEVPDVILLDLILPWMNGIEVLAQIRLNPAYAAIPVLVTTGAATHERDLRIYAPLALMRKPLVYEALVPTIERLLLERRFL